MESPTKKRASMNVKRLTRLALFLALALILQYLESLLPYLIPGLPIRVGLANIVVLYALVQMGRRDAALIGLTRCLLFMLVTGRAFSALYALAGSALSLGVMCLLLGVCQKGRISLYGLSMAGAFAFQLGQLAVGVCAAGSVVLAYLPWLGLLSIPCGAVTALLAALLIQILPASMDKDLCP